LVAACLALGCGAHEFRVLGSIDCVPHSPGSVTASDYDAAHDVVALGYGDGSFELRRDATKLQVCGEHSKPISNLAFAPDGAVVATGDRGGRVALSHVDARVTEPLIELTSEVLGLAFSPSGSLIALSAGPEVVLVDRLGARKALASLQGAVGAVTFSPDGRHLIAAGGRLTFLSVPELRVERSVSIRGEGIGEAAVATDVRFSPDGHSLGVLLLSGAAILNLDNGQLATSGAGRLNPVGLRFAPDGRLAVFGRHGLYVGPAEPERIGSESSGTAGELADVEFRRDGSLLVVGGPLVPNPSAPHP